MTLAQRLTSLIQAIAQDIKSLGNRIDALEGQGAALIDGGTPSTPTTDILKIDFGGVQ